MLENTLPYSLCLTGVLLCEMLAEGNLTANYVFLQSVLVTCVVISHASGLLGVLLVEPIKSPTSRQRGKTYKMTQHLFF